MGWLDPSSWLDAILDWFAELLLDSLNTMIAVINAGSGRNTATEDKFPRCVLPRRFDFGFATELLYKDVRLCLEVGESLGVPMMVGGAVKQLLALTKAGEGDTADITRIVRTVERWAGAEVKGKAAS